MKQHSLGTYLLPYLEQNVFRMYHSDCSWFDWPNQPAVKQQMSIWQCPSVQANRVQDGSLITVTPPAVILFSGQAACGDYAGMLQVDPGLVATALVDAVPNPGGVFPVNDTTRIADIRDGTSHTIAIAECAGRPQLWHKTTPVPNTWLTGGPSGIARPVVGSRRDPGRDRVLWVVRHQLHERSRSVQLPHRWSECRVRRRLGALSACRPEHPRVRAAGDAGWR